MIPPELGGALALVRRHRSILTAPLRVVLVSCGKRKRKTPTPAGQLYVGGLAGPACKYAAADGAPWYILSARHGLLPPDRLTAPYERGMEELSPAERRVWAKEVVRDLRLWARGEPLHLEIHAGKRYLDALKRALPSAWTVGEPLKGLGTGQRRGWYRRQRG
jgi:hypothetical protein